MTEKVDVQERKDKINEVLNIRGHDKNSNEKLIDIFDPDTKISMTIDQKIGDEHFKSELDEMTLNADIDDFDGLDLGDEDVVVGMFQEIVRFRLSEESVYAE